MQNEQMKKMMNGAVVLSVAALLTKLLSAVYKVPLQNLTGDEGFYVYQQVYPLYGIAAALSLNGLPVFVSKLTAELSLFEEQREALKRVFLLLLLAGAGFWALCWFGAPALAGWMGDPRLAPLIRSVSFVYLMLPVVSVGRGYFQGSLNMLPTGVSQVGEQLVRVGIILLAAFWFARSDWTVYQMGTLSMSASWIAGLVAVSILGVFLRKEITEKKTNFVITPVQPIPYKTLFTRLLTEGMAISAFSSLLIFLQLIDSFTVYNGLLDSGLGKAAAMSAKGVYDRGQPLVQLGMVVGTGFASSLLPLLSRQRTEKRTEGFTRTASSVLRITAVFASAATVGLVVLMPQFNYTLFSDTAGTAVLRVYVLGIVVASLIGGVNAILQSMNQQTFTFIGLAAGIAFKAAANRTAVAIWGTMGASVTTVGALVVVLLVLSIRVPRLVREGALHFSFLRKLLLALLGMSAGVFLAVSAAENLLPAEERWTALTAALSGVAVGAGVFFILLLKTRALTIREWLSLPLGRKLLKKGQE